MNGVKIRRGFVNEPVIKDGLVPLCEVTANPINDVLDMLPCELLLSEVFIIPPVGGKELAVAIVDDDTLQNLQLDMLQKHQTYV